MVPVRTAAALLLVLLSAGVAHGFQLRKSDDGKVLIWDANNVKVKIDTSSPAAPAGAADAVKAGFWAWTSAGVPLKVHFSMASSPLALAVDGVNAVLWQTQEWKYGKSVVAMTVSSYSKSSAFVSESDLVLNARDHSWRVDPQPGAPDYDVQNVVAHEAGHFFGLGHSARPEATMYATTPPAETAKRSLSADDRDGIAALIAEINRRRQLPGGGKGDTSRAQAQPSSPSDTELTARGEAVGCSMAGGAGGSWIWPALLLLLGLVLRRAWFAALALVALFPAPAGATVVHRLALDQLHRQASAVVSGEVVASRTRVLPGSKLIVTNHVISVRRCFKRGPCPQAVTVQTLGGEVGDRGMLVEGMPRLARGQQVVVFGRRSGAVLLPVGLAQGVFHISGHWAVRDLRGLDLLVNAKRVRGEVQRHDLRALEAALERLAAQ